MGKTKNVKARTDILCKQMDFMTFKTPTLQWLLTVNRSLITTLEDHKWRYQAWVTTMALEREISWRNYMLRYALKVEQEWAL